jgi:putative transcriptional regulator
MKSLRGHFLVASTQLKDANFYRSVVLLVQHDDDGALGLILNRPTGKTVRDAMELVVDEPTACDDLIYLGGPVRGPIAVVHTDEGLGNVEIVPGAYYTVEDELVNELLQKEGIDRRVFLGYSGWAPGQLESELTAGGWQVAPATLADIFTEPDQLWRLISRRIGRDFLSATIKPRVVPDDPSLN